jgi:hypothetical protein
LDDRRPCTAMRGVAKHFRGTICATRRDATNALSRAMANAGRIRNVESQESEHGGDRVRNRLRVRSRLQPLFQKDHGCDAVGMAAGSSICKRVTGQLWPEAVVPEPMRSIRSSGALERSAGESGIHPSAGRHPSRVRHKTAPVCATAAGHLRASFIDSAPVDARPARGPSTRGRDLSQPCFTIGHALSLKGRAASSAGTVASSLR